jgi:hypothetical protein
MMNVAEVGEVVSKIQARRWGINDERLGLMGRGTGRELCSKLVMS